MIYCENISGRDNFFFLLIHRFHNFFFSIFGNGIATIAKTIFLFFFTFSAMPLPQLICHKFFELIIINHVWFIVKILWMWQLFFFYSFTDFIIFFFHFRQWDCHNCQNKFFFFFFTLSAMALPQLPKQFFFLPISAMELPQLGSHKFFFLPISAMSLPQLVCHKFF